MQRRQSGLPLASPTSRQSKRLSACTVSLAAGACAGMSVEAAVFPLDCLKTRAQSRNGLVRFPGGAFRGMYRGVGSAVAGAAPASAVFFTVYECAHHSMQRNLCTERDSYLSFCGAALLASIMGELAASTVRVPTDIVKQRLQTGCVADFPAAVRSLIAGGLPLVLDSFRTTALRDIMHSSVQFPMYEGLKLTAARQLTPIGMQPMSADKLPPSTLAACGSFAGAASAFVTTPLDWLRTRVNLRMAGCPEGAAGRPCCRTVAVQEARETLQLHGYRGLFAGAGYRASSMGLGGFIFFGAFEMAKRSLNG